MAVVPGATVWLFTWSPEGAPWYWLSLVNAVSGSLLVLISKSGWGEVLAVVVASTTSTAAVAASSRRADRTTRLLVPPAAVRFGVISNVRNCTAPGLIRGTR